MAAISGTTVTATKNAGEIRKYYGTSTANQTDTLTSPVVPVGTSERLLYTLCKYSAGPTQTGVQIEIKSAIGATYDTTIAAHTANGQNNFFIPDEEVRLFPGDAIRVTAPAGGGGITAAIQIVLERN